MENELKLTEFRTKEELKKYLLSKGLDASDDAINNLKKQYSDEKITNSTLNMQELNDVAGGTRAFIFTGNRESYVKVEEGKFRPGVSYDEQNDFTYVILPNREKGLDVYYVPELELRNGYFDFDAIADKRCPIDNMTEEYLDALGVARQFIFKFNDQGKNIYGRNESSTQLTREEQALIDFRISNCTLL